MTRFDWNGAARGGARALLAAVLAGGLAAGAGCGSVLDVDLPGQVTDEQLDDPALANTMLVSALGEFECALNELVPTNAFLTGEFISSNFFLTSNVWGWRGEVEIKATPGSCPTARASTDYGYYVPLQRARFLAKDAARRIEQFPDAAVPQKTKMLATLEAYEGYSLTWLGESSARWHLTTARS
jgi:hypothetical protein